MCGVMGIACSSFSIVTQIYIFVFCHTWYVMLNGFKVIWICSKVAATKFGHVPNFLCGESDLKRCLPSNQVNSLDMTLTQSL